MDACRLCEGTDISVAFQVDGRNIYRCKTCSVMFQQLSSEQKRYIEEQWGDYEDLYYTFRKKTYSILLDKIKPINKQRLLDVGCALGWFMTMAAEVGFDVFGIEPSTNEAKKAYQITGRPVQIALIENAPYPDRFFNVLTLFDVLEHTLDPFSCLQEIRRLLVDHGILVIRVPDQDGLLPRVAQWLNFLSHGRYSEPLRLLWKFHKWGFNYRAIRNLLRRSRFEVLEHYGEDSLDISNLKHKKWCHNKIIAVGVASIIYFSHLCNKWDERVVIARKLPD